MNDKKILFALVIVVALVIGGWFVFGKNKAQTKPKSAETAQLSQGESIKLSSSASGKYIPDVIKVKVGTKVRIEGDPATLSGGMDTVIIDGYDVRKVIAPGDNMIEFVADKTGTFKIYCANGMGNGRLVVE